MTQTKSILITGCSSGIGLYAAQILQKRGWRVFAGARKVDDVTRLNSLGLESIQLDVDDAASIERALGWILAKTGNTLDALFNNAGFVQAGAIEDLSRAQIRAQFETNVFGAIELTNHVIPIMRRQGYGRIIQNTSILGIITLGYRGAYNASKFALEGFSQTLRQELHGSGIHVSMIVPGAIESALRANALAHLDIAHTQHSPHHPTYQHMQQHFFDASGGHKKAFAKSPRIVVAQLIKALESPRPRAHYYVTFPAHLLAMLRRLLPDSWLEAILRYVTHKETR